MWEATRTVTKTATVSLHGNTYGVDPSLVGRRIQLQLLPGDLQAVTVWHQGKPMGQATAAEIRTHTDPKLPDANPPQTGLPTGIAYLEALTQDHARDLRASLSYHQPPAGDHHNHPDDQGDDQ